MHLHQYWQLFGLTDSASHEDLRSSYRKLVRRWHPDNFAGDDARRRTAEEHMKLINEAYRVLAATYIANDDLSNTYGGSGSRQDRHMSSDSEVTAIDSAVRWLQSEFALTYLPLVLAVLMIGARKFEQLVPTTGVVSLLLIIAWSMMVSTVWRHDGLSARSRSAWIILMIIFGGMAVPVYFARHVRRTTA